MDSNVHFDEDKSVKNQIKTELEDLKKMVVVFGPDRFRDGTWWDYQSAYPERFQARMFKSGSDSI